MRKDESVASPSVSLHQLPVHLQLILTAFCVCFKSYLEARIHLFIVPWQCHWETHHFSAYIFFCLNLPSRDWGWRSILKASMGMCNRLSRSGMGFKVAEMLLFRDLRSRESWMTLTSLGASDAESWSLFSVCGFASSCLFPHSFLPSKDSVSLKIVVKVAKCSQGFKISVSGRKQRAAFKIALVLLLDECNSPLLGSSGAEISRTRCTSLRFVLFSPGVAFNTALFWSDQLSRHNSISGRGLGSRPPDDYNVRSMLGLWKQAMGGQITMAAWLSQAEALMQTGSSACRNGDSICFNNAHLTEPMRKTLPSRSCNGVDWMHCQKAWGYLGHSKHLDGLSWLCRITHACFPLSPLLTDISPFLQSQVHAARSESWDFAKWSWFSGSCVADFLQKRFIFRL